jgi:ferritin-like metal-binding protein YciE
MMKIKDLESMLDHELRDLYSAEKQILKALPKLTSHVSDPEMVQALEKHIEETKQQVLRLEEAHKILKGSALRAETCKGMEGVLKEGDEALESAPKGPLLDAAIAAGCLRVEHYETAGYTASIAIATQLGQKEIVALLQQTLTEETKAGKTLESLSKVILKQAASEPVSAR